MSVYEVEKNSSMLTMSVRRGRRKLWLGLWNEIFGIMGMWKQ